MRTNVSETVEELTGLAALGQDAALVVGESGESNNAAQIGARLAEAPA